MPSQIIARVSAGKRVSGSNFKPCNSSDAMAITPLEGDRGIKNFRVLNKKEFEKVLAEGVTQEQIDNVVSGAVARWKSGWGSKKK